MPDLDWEVIPPSPVEADDVVMLRRGASAPNDGAVATPAALVAAMPAATVTDPGIMSAADKTKLDGVASGAQVNVPTDLSYTAATRVIASSTGADATLPTFTSTDPGLVPASGGGTTNFLRADGTFAAPPGGGSYTELGPTRYYGFDDCLGVSANNSGEQGFYTINSGTGAAQNAVSPQDGGIGWFQFAMGTTATGRTARMTQAQAIDFANGPCEYRARMRIAALSDGTNTYSCRAGFIDTPSAETVDGAFFRYTHSVNGGRFQAVCRGNSVETGSVVDTGVTVAINTTYVLEVEVDASVPQAVFKIDGTTVATITTNIPTGATRATGAGAMTLKSAGTTATSSWQMDYQSVEQILSGRT